MAVSESLDDNGISAMPLTFGDSYFRNKLVDWVKTQRTERLVALSQGVASDFSDYTNRVGYIAALDDFLITMHATEREMNAAPDRQERM